MASAISISDRKIPSVTPVLRPSGPGWEEWAVWECEFNRCWPWLEASLKEFFQTHTRDQVWERIVDRRGYFWPGRECAIIGQLVKHPIGIKSFNYWLQGGKLGELLTMHPGIEAWARSRGCTVATGLGRDGWARAMEGNWQKGPATRIKWL